MFIHAYASLYTHQASAVYLSSGKKWTKRRQAVPGIPCKRP